MFGVLVIGTFNTWCKVILEGVWSQDGVITGDCLGVFAISNTDVSGGNLFWTLSAAGGEEAHGE